MTLLWVTVVVLALLTAICLLALVDQYRSLELIKAKLKLEDSPEPIPLPTGRDLAPSSIGLPAELDDREHLVVLFLSTSCTTCRTICQEMPSRAWSSVWVVLEQSHSIEDAQSWFTQFGVPSGVSSVDVDGGISNALEVSVTPAAVLYRKGKVLVAQTIPSTRQLTPLLDERTSSRLQALETS